MIEIKKDELDRFRGMERETLKYLNLNPIQRGGILTPEAHKTLSQWGDGYSICDFCDEGLERIKKPPVNEFMHNILPRFIEADVVRLTGGARESIYMVIHATCKPGTTIIVDSNAHYTTHIAAERNSNEVVEVSNTGYPEYKINENEYIEKIDEVKKKTKKNPSLAVLTYPDGNYGNLPDARKVAEICLERDIPLLLNCAYALGRMPVSLRKTGADFIVGSGHKSMASSGPIGILGTKEEWRSTLLKKSRRFRNKELELMGCGPRGLPTVTLMASFPQVYERVKRWGEEVRNARYFIEKIEGIGGIRQLGVRPTEHDLSFLETDIFYEISKKHRRGRFFLYRELKKRGIVGIKPGLTRNFKLSTYGLKKDELKKVIDAFKDISTLK